MRMYPYYHYDIYHDIFHMSTGASTFWLLMTCLTIAALWVIFDKAGEPGWAAIIPFYNFYELFKITWGNGWLFLLLLIPIANFVIGIITLVKLAKVFGKGGGWACGLIFLYPIFICITAFSRDIVYVGVNGRTADYNYGDYGQSGNAGYGYDAGRQQEGYQNPYSQSYQKPQDDYQHTDNAERENSQDAGQFQKSNQNPNYYYSQTQTGANSSVKYCAGCGMRLGANDKFCPRCGKEAK